MYFVIVFAVRLHMFSAMSLVLLLYTLTPLSLFLPFKHVFLFLISFTATHVDCFVIEPPADQGKNRVLNVCFDTLLSIERD